MSLLPMASVNPTAPPPPAPAGKPATKGPGWPGQNAFRLIVPGWAVGFIIGHGGHFIKRISDQTGARLQIIAPPAGNTDRIVLITGKEQLHLKQSPAMNAVIEICKHVTGSLHADANGVAARASLVTVTFLVECKQSLTLLGRHGSTLREIERSSGTIIGILSKGYAGVPFYVSQDERLIKIQGQVLKVMTAVKAVLNHLRRYLVDISVIPAFSEKYKIGTWQPDQRLSSHHLAPAYQPGADSGYPLPLIEHGAEVNAGIPSFHSSVYAPMPVPDGGLSSMLTERGTEVHAGFSSSYSSFYAPMPVPGGNLPSMLIERGAEVNAGIPSSHSSFHAAMPVPGGGLPSMSTEHVAEVKTGIPSSHSSLYAPMPVPGGGLPSMTSGHVPVPAQRIQRIRIPYVAARHIIGIGSETIDHIRKTSGSIITIEGDGNLIDQYILEDQGNYIPATDCPTAH